MVTNLDNITILSTITEKNVRTALDILIYSSNMHLTLELHQLTLVEKFLMDANFPPSPYNRNFALSYLLTSIITDKLTHCRSVLHQIRPQQEKTLNDAQTAIRADIQTANLELIGWSILYYRYVQIDLGISPRSISQIASVDERTVRRYQQHGIRRLTVCLLEREWIERSKH